jgi:hypothetical protein
MRAFKVKPKILNNNPLVRLLFEQMHYQQLCQADLAERAGLHKDTVRKWRVYHTPRVPELEAALNCVGYTLKAVKMKEKNYD